MYFNKHPLLPIAIFYICGIIFARYFFIPNLVYACLIVLSLLIKKLPYRKITFCLAVFSIGCLFYQLSFQCEFLAKFQFLKEHIREIISYNVPEGSERDLWSGLFLGERFRLSPDLLNVLKNTNTMHILAISGLHVGFIGTMFLGIFRLLYIPRKLAALLALIIVLVYVLIVGLRPPTLRAAIMFSVLVFGWIIDRPVDTINSLSLAAIIILILSPSALFEAGFQLSFIIVLSLLLVVPAIRGSYLKKALYGSFAAWTASLPLVAHYFKVISPISILANLVVVPGITLVIAIGFTSILFGSIYIGLSGIFNATNYYLTKMLIAFLECISEIPFAYYDIRYFPIYMVFLSYILIILIYIFILQKKRFVVE